MAFYHEASELIRLCPTDLDALKSKVFDDHGIFRTYVSGNNPKGLYTLVAKTLKWNSILKEVVENSEILREPELRPALALVLVYDFLISQGGVALPATHGLRVLLERHRRRLEAEFKKVLNRLSTRCTLTPRTVKEWQPVLDSEFLASQGLRVRWLRVNRLKTSVDEQISALCSAFADPGAPTAELRRLIPVESLERVDSTCSSDRPVYKRYWVDGHIPNLMCVSHWLDVTALPSYQNGEIIIQDKASCFSACLLDPRPGEGDVIDATAAPGNKTTHLAAILHEREQQRGEQRIENRSRSKIFAFEKDPRRSETLQRMVDKAGAGDRVAVRNQDFLQVDPNAEAYSNVTTILLDPSCSGSGMTGRDLLRAHLPMLPRAGGQQAKHEKKSATKATTKASMKAAKRPRKPEDEKQREKVEREERQQKDRLASLAAFQVRLLEHAFRFPAVERVVYSTCSLETEENEEVALKALQSEVAQSRRWRLLLREEQTEGMQTWPIRGLSQPWPHAYTGSGDDVSPRDLSDACLRSAPRDAECTIGFFAVCFTRDGATGVEARVSTGKGNRGKKRLRIEVELGDAKREMGVPRKTKKRKRKA